MKINQAPDNASLPSVNTAATPKSGAQPSATATKSENATANTRSAGVKVSVSAQALALEKTRKTEAAEIDAQKVASVRAAIQEGSFTVNPEAIADKLLANAQEMLRRTKQ